MKKILYLVFIPCICLTLVGSKTVFAVNKITLSPVSASVSEGQAQTITVKLDQPIGTGNTVSMYITSSNPDSVSIVPNTVIFTASEWNNTKSFTVTALTNQTYGDTRNVLLIASASSGSVYYNGYTTGASLHIADTTPAPSTSAPQDPPPHEDDDPVTETPPEEDEELPDPVPPITTSSGSRQPDRIIYYAGSPAYPQADNAPTTDGSNWEAITSFIVPPDAPLQQKIGAVTAAILALIAACIAPIVFLRRKVWVRRQKAKHLRWMYRHSK
jgi:hypothetical protein